MGLKQRRIVDLGAHPLAGEFIKEPLLPRFSEDELDKFGEELENFMEEKTFVAKGKYPGGTGRVLNFNEAACSYGALRKIEYLNNPCYLVRLKAIDFDDYGNPRGYQQPSLYERFVDKYEQYSTMMSRRNFIEKKKLEGLQELADSMGIEHTAEEIELGAL